MPFLDVTINYNFTDPSAQKTSSTSTTTKPNKPSRPPQTSTTRRSSNNTTTATTAKPNSTKSSSGDTRSTPSGTNDLSTAPTNKRTTTAPNNTATKGYKLENNTDDDMHISSIHPLTVPISTTEVSIRDVTMIFDPIIGDRPHDDATFRPLISVTDNMIPHHSLVDPLIENETIPWPTFQNVSMTCQINPDCSKNEICVYGQCKGLCGPQNFHNCFSGTLLILKSFPSDLFKSTLFNYIIVIY